jgi:hypothetical protein
VADAVDAGDKEPVALWTTVHGLAVYADVSIHIDGLTDAQTAELQAELTRGDAEIKRIVRS